MLQFCASPTNWRESVRSQSCRCQNSKGGPACGPCYRCRGGGILPVWKRHNPTAKSTIKSMSSKKIVIIGAGPTGLGAAYRLHELGHDNWIVYEKSDEVGGHSTSHIDDKGFVWDEGGHVIFSHYPYFDALIERMLGKEVHERIRESWIVNGDCWV